MEEGCQGEGEMGVGKGKEKKWTRIDLSFVFMAKSLNSSHSTQPRIAISCSFHFISCIFIHLYDYVLFILCFWHVLPPPLCFPLFFCPTLTPPPGLASVGRFQSVCLLMTLLEADVMLSSCCFAVSPLPPYLIPVFPIPPFYMFACLFAVP